MKHFKLVMLGLILNNSAMAGSDQSYIGRATGPAKQCFDESNFAGLEIGSNVETTGICFVSGQIHRVTFYAGPKCHPQQPCQKFMSFILATVDFGCNDEIVDVNCGSK